SMRHSPTRADAGADAMEAPPLSPESVAPRRSVRRPRRPGRRVPHWQYATRPTLGGMSPCVRPGTPRAQDRRPQSPRPREGPEMPPDEGPLVHILWLNSGLGCDGDSVALTAAMQPSIEEIVLGALPGLPRVAVHWLLIDYQCGDDFMQWFWKADRGEIDPFVLVVEGSIPNEDIKKEGYWAAMGNRVEGGGRDTQPMTTSEWLDRLAPKALAVLAVGTCATYGGIHAMSGNPTGAMGVPDHLGWGWKSKAGIPIVCVPGCPIHPDNLAETILYLLYQATGAAPMIPLDDQLRPTWLF